MNNFSSTEPSWIQQREQPITPDMTFEDAASVWIASRLPTTAFDGRRRGYIRKTTEVTYRLEIRTLNLFFGNTRLSDVRLDHVTTYQRLRVAGAEPFIRYRRPQDARPRLVGGELVPAKGKTPCPVSPKQVNQELSTFIRILKRAGVWTEEGLGRLYEPLIEEIVEQPRALNPQEQRHWLDVARSSQRWNVVHWFSLLAFDTCMGPNEIRALRLRDINLQQRQVTVPPEGAKNQGRHRSIPIATEDAMWGLERLVARAQELGACEPQHYLFPRYSSMTVSGIKKRYDPSQPMTVSGIKKLWEEVRTASKLTWFRQYDCRHTAITRLAEAGVPIAMIMKRAGHLSLKMMEHYTHISDRTQVYAVRMAHQYFGDGGSGAPPATAPVYLPVPVQRTAQSAEVVGQLLSALQTQCGLTAAELRDALLAQTQ